MKRFLLIALIMLTITNAYSAEPNNRLDPYELLGLPRKPLSRLDILDAYSDALFKLSNTSSLQPLEKIKRSSALDKASTDMLLIKSETSAQASAGTNWNFELKNNTRYPIKVSLTNNNGPIGLSESKQNEFELEGKKSSLPFLSDPVPLVRLSSVPTHLVTTITIRNQQGQLLGQFELDFPTSKSFFLVWEGDSLRPQKGSDGYTTSGLSLASNIDQKHIKTIVLEKR